MYSGTRVHVKSCTDSSHKNRLLKNIAYMRMNTSTTGKWFFAGLFKVIYKRRMSARDLERPWTAFIMD